MSRICGNCESGYYSCNTLNINKIISGNYTEKMVCDFGRIEVPTTPDSVCEEHKYIKGMEEYNIYVEQDDSYLGEGFFIIYELNGEIVKLAKIYISNCFGFPHYNIRAYEKDSVDQDWQQYRSIEMSVDTEEELFNVFKNLANALQGKRIISIEL